MDITCEFLRNTKTAQYERKKVMKNRMRYLSSILAAAMVIGNMPATALAAPASDTSAKKGQETRVEASEIEGVSRLDDREWSKREDQAEPLYKADDVVTVIVEMEEAPVMDYYSTSTYSETAEASDKTAGEAVADFLADEEVKELSQELRDGQNDVLAGIAQLAGAGNAVLASENENEVQPAEEESFEVTAQWTTIANAAAVRVPYRMLEDIKKLDGVKRAYVEHVYDRPEPVENASLETELTTREGVSYRMAGVDGAWKEGYTGKGMLVAVLDSGLDIKLDNEGRVIRTHEAFTENSFYSGNPTDGENDWELRYTNESLAKFLEDNQLISTTGADGNKIVYDNNALFKNVKVPYACDYADGDLHVMPASSDHGTHVSGTVTGYAETEEGEVKFTGVAPDAQLVFMKVFPDEDGGAQESVLINALEDSLRLGVDMINLSLGSDNGYAMDDTMQHEYYQRVEEAGIAMMTSAGNSAYSSSNNNYSGENLASNPEISMMSAPAVYDSNLSVASIDNGINVQSYFIWKDAEGQAHKVGYSDPFTVAMKAGFSDKEYPVYEVGGVGTAADYAAVGFNNGWNNGKTGFALVKRGEISFADKINNAMNYTGVNSQGERYGVLGVLIYDSDPNGTELINMSADGTSITSAFISGQDGAAMTAALQNGQEVKIQVSMEDETISNPTAGQMSSYTSWGAGPGLELKPEITAPGGNIWSTVVDKMNTGNEGYTGGYEMMSGTSMAAPHMTGISALVRQYITSDEKFGQVEKKAEADLISQLLVSTAIPQKDTNGVYYSPRQQGAGLVNAEAAVKTPAYITVDGKNVGKLEFSDDPEKKGVYDIGFHVNNVSDQEVTYEVQAVLLRPDSQNVDSAWGSRQTISARDVLLSETSLGEITVPAKGTAAFESQVALTKEQKDELNDLFKNGTYVEGFVILTDKAGTNPQLGLPMLSFYGDWTAAPIFDSASWFDEPQDGENVFNNESTWNTTIVGSQIIAGSEVIGYINAGQNLFDTESTEEQGVYHKENITISPNGDGYLDKFDDYIIYQLRNARLLVFEVKDQKTGEVYFRDWDSYVFKTTYDAQYGFVFPFSLYGTHPVWDGTDLEGNPLPSGTQCEFTITAYGEGDYGEEVYNEEAGRYVSDFDSIIPGEKEPTFNGHAMDMTGDVISFPVTVDTVAPKLENSAVSIYEKDGRTYISGKVYDEDGSIASVEVVPYVVRSYSDQAIQYGADPEYAETALDRLNPFYLNNVYDPATKTLEFEADITEYVRENKSYQGEEQTYKFTWNGNLMISCGDYGLNDRNYIIKADATPGIVLSQTSALLHPGSEFELSVNNNTGDTESVLTRTSSNPEVATIDEYGKVKAIAPGQTIITVSNGTSSAICVVAVDEIHTEVEDFKLSVDKFDGLKPDGELVVKVTDLQPADVQLDEIRWVFEEDEEYAENYAAGLVTVQKETSDGLSGSLYMNVRYSQEELPAGGGTLTVTLNGISRTMRLGWGALPTSSDEDDLISAASFGGQSVYVTQGETAELGAKYRQGSSHEAGDVITELTGLKLDGPDFFMVGGGSYQPYVAKLVNEEGYALPESIHVYTVYDDGYSYEMTAGGYYGYTYNAQTGELSIPAPYGATNKLKIVADGVVSEGNPAGEMSGEVYTKPDGLWGPFDWEVTEGTGSLEMAEKTDYNGSREVANYTPSEPGVSYITASSKDGNYSVNYAVICEPVKAETLALDKHNVTVKEGKKKSLTPTLTPVPTLEKDQTVIYKSFAPEVATVDENGVITGIAGGYAYIKAYSAADNRVMDYCVVEVKAKTMVDENLERTIALIENLDSSVYTEDSWKKIEEALAAAKAVADDENATQAETDQALIDLLAAFSELTEAQKVHLETILQAAEEILAQSENYQNAEALRAAVEAGRAVLAKESVTQEELDHAVYSVLQELSKMKKKADIVSLESVLAAAEEMLDDNFTDETLENLRNAMDEAERVIADQDRGENDIRDAYTALIDAILGLERTGNKAALHAMIVKANEILDHKSDYVASTTEGLADVLADAQAVYDDASAVQSTIDDAVRALTMKAAAVRLIGDVNADGKISTSDSVLLLQYAAEKITLDAEAMESADVNGDGIADTSDATRILQYSAEKISSF